MRVEIDGIDYLALADRALLRADASALIVADLHLGKPAAFRAGGVPVPEGVTTTDLERLSRLVIATNARRLVILGDLLHAAQGRTPATMNAVANWRLAHAGLAITLVRGNHDRNAGDPPSDWNVACIDGPAELDGMMLAHEPCHVPTRTVLCGHLHPEIRLASVAKSPGGAARARCLWITRDWAVLPAFGGFTGGQCIRPAHDDRLIAFAEGCLFEVPARALA